MMLADGLSYVWAAYGIVYSGLALYAVSLFVRQRELLRERNPDDLSVE